MVYFAPNIMIAPPDLEPTEAELLKVINDIEIAEARMGMIEQAEAAKTKSDRWHHIDGDVEMQVNSFTFHFWGRKLGYECWNDEAFKREIRRDNPSVRVKNHSRKILSGYTPTQPKYHKAYR